MKFNTRFFNKENARPYLVLTVAALLAYLPVSSMLFTLKNDVLAIEYPVRYFMSEAIRNGESPLWFNTWCFGFPLQSVLTWGVFSSTAIFASIFPADIVALHVSFILYIILSGWIMYRLLTRHFLPSKDLSLLLSCCYMLSGFTVSSSQWLLYITGMVFIPLILYCALNLLKNPSWRNSFLIGLSFFLLLTNVHIYLTVFACYFFVIFFAVTLIRISLDNKKSKAEKSRLWLFVSLGVLFTVLFCAAPAYYTIETITYLERSDPLMEGSAFFRSNYLHPEGFKSLLLPLSSVKTVHFNTEGSILNIYMGLLPLLIFPVSLMANWRDQNRKAWLLFFISLFFLVLSFGHLTPLREWLNILPGLSYFRHPGVLRIFFTMAFILYLGVSFRKYNLKDLLTPGTPERKYIIYGLLFLALISLVVSLLNVQYLPGIYKGSLAETVRSVSNGELMAINSIIQSCFCLLLLFAVIKKSKLFATLVSAELILNFLLCTPFYAVSSHAAKTVNHLMEFKKGFPVQSSLPYDVPAEIKGEGETVWRNTNTFRKEVSVNVSMPGPLILKHVHSFLMEGGKEVLKDKPLVFRADTMGVNGSLKIIEQKPAKVRIAVSLERSSGIILQQAYFPGWKAYYNGEQIGLSKQNFPFVSAEAPAGDGELEFRFEKKGALYAAILLHGMVLITLLTYVYRRSFLRSASPS